MGQLKEGLGNPRKGPQDPNNSVPPSRGCYTDGLEEHVLARMTPLEAAKLDMVWAELKVSIHHYHMLPHAPTRVGV